MRIAIITDVHANVIALRAVLEALETQQPDLIVHLGDAIAIGPYPAETLDLLLNTPNMLYVMGNHDWWFADGLPQPQPDWMSDGEVAHQQWTHAQLDPGLRKTVAQWPFVLERTFDGVRVAFLHYGLRDQGPDFVDIVQDATVDDFDRMFSGYEADIIFHGHTHRYAAGIGRAYYINPGALGVNHGYQAHFLLLDCSDGNYKFTRGMATYKLGDVLHELDVREVPEREFIKRVFFGRE
jgi:predicted phosphodiesterase